MILQFSEPLLLKYLLTGIHFLMLKAQLICIYPFWTECSLWTYYTNSSILKTIWHRQIVPLFWFLEKSKNIKNQFWVGFFSYSTHLKGFLFYRTWTVTQFPWTPKVVGTVLELRARWFISVMIGNKLPCFIHTEGFLIMSMEQKQILLMKRRKGSFESNIQDDFFQ